MNFSNMTPSHRQQFFTDCCNTGHSSTGCNPSGTASFCVGTPQNHKSCQENVSSIGSSLHRSADLPQGHSFPSGIHLLQCGSSPQAAGESLHPHGFPRAMGDSCLNHGLHHRLQKNLCSSACSTSSPPSALALMCGELCSHIFLLHSSLATIEIAQ